MARVRIWRLALLCVAPLLAWLFARQFEVGTFHGRERTLRGDAQAAVTNLRNAIRVRRILDSVKVLPRTKESIGGVRLDVLGDSAGLPVVTAVRAELRREIGTLPSRTAPWAVVVLVRRGRQFSGFWGELIDVGDWTPCTILPFDPGEPDSLDAWPRLLGQCAFAAYGPPGAGVRQWLAQTTRRFGEPALFNSRSSPPRDAEGRVVIEASLSDRSWWQAWTPEEMRLLACRAGDEDACRMLIGSAWNRSLRGELLWWLKQRHGDEAFARFWRFDGDVDAAARAAFGHRLPELAGEYLRQHYRIVDNGPRPPADAPLMAGWVLGASLFVSLFLARRRSVA